ncbi:MAG: glycosyltransferase family 9 protein [Chloroflexota bacterium]|nr:glycosyltransferase family 9 protein [Chloroflexota bacterium]MDQ5865593.1 glycosyltransferase family 9 protein [Chloroflexota bacterium]
MHDRGEPKRILLMMLLPIGDTLFTTPSLNALRRRYPRAEITAVVYPTNKGILSNNPDIDRFLLWPTRHRWPGLAGVLKLFWGLRRARFDLAVEFSNYNWWVSWLSGIPRRTEMNLPRFWWGLPWAGIEWRKHHAVEHYTGPVSRLGVTVDDLALRIFPSEQEKAKALSWLERYRVGPDELLVGIHPGGEGLWGRKQWSVARFAEVADGLSARTGARIVIMGGKDDAPAAAEIASRTTASIINAAGQTTLGETAALVRHCALFIGNDSSPLHIAAASGTPVVGIYGPTDPRSYRPWIPGGKQGVDYAVVRSNLPCACKFPLVGGTTIAGFFTCLSCPALESITPEQVLDAAIRLLERGLMIRVTGNP